MNRKTQSILILNYLLEGHSITQMQAAAKFNIWRLAAIVHKLKRRGFNIQKTTLKGRINSYASYFMGCEELNSPEIKTDLND